MGPYRFRPGTGPGESPDGRLRRADPAGRAVPLGEVFVGEELPFALEPTNPPLWSRLSHDTWQAEQGTVLRLEFEARREGWEPWTLRGEIDAAGPRVADIP